MNTNLPWEWLMRAGALRTLIQGLILAPLLLVAIASPASACPFCEGGPSGVNEVRDGIFDRNFWPRAAATFAPFPIFASIVTLIYFGPTGFARRRHAKDSFSAISSPANRHPQDR